ncbi:MAG: hypothetical protein HAW63_03980 [Bdellovibrionaceae bacterium]|nr:hypothetical protein [Pseudobdellovibrionaceae bacterium]
MKKIYNLFIVGIMFIVLSGCSSMQISDNLYSSSEVGRSKILRSCRVLASRIITIRSDHSGEQGESIGFLTGSLATNNKSPIINIVGGLVGGVIGRKVSDKLHSRKGVEYTVILSNGEERTLVQDLKSGERMLPTHTSCRLQISGSYNRVLPAGHLPNKVKRPKKVKFSN